MKNWLLIGCLPFFLFACDLDNDQLTEEDLPQEIEEEENHNNNNGDPETVVVNTVCEYAPFTTGSSFTFKGDLGQFTWSVQNSEIIDGEEYAPLLDDQTGEKTYFSCDGSDYIQLMVNPDNGEFYPFTYLKTDLAVGETWEVNTPKGLYTLTVEYFYLEYDFNGFAFSDVYEIHREGPPADNDVDAQYQSTNWFYAKDVGLVYTTWDNVSIQSYDIQ